MSQPSAYEQYLLELINADRAKVGAQPLAFNEDLNDAAGKHSAWMIATDTFSHTGAGGSTAGQRMAAEGYAFTGSWRWGENIAWATTRNPAGLQDEVSLLHTNLMNSSGHRANILNANYKEVGLGFEVGEYRGRETAFVTEDFAASGTRSFLTGVAFDDRNGNRFYDVGEGLGGLTITVTNASGALVGSVATSDAGGYSLGLSAGSYTVTFSGDGIEPSTHQVTIGSRNVKLDLMDPVMATTAPPAPEPPAAPEPPPPAPAPPPAAPSVPTPTLPDGRMIVGTERANTIQGSSGNDLIRALGGNDTVYGNAGNDTILGGNGNDRLFGGAGNDMLDGGAGSDRLFGDAGNDILSGGLGNDFLTGGSGRDSFLFNTAPGRNNVDKILDFSPADDTILLDRSVYTAFASTGTIAASAFHVGTFARDALDRIIYDQRSGSLFYDRDGSGFAPAVPFASVTPGTALTYADILIV